MVQPAALLKIALLHGRFHIFQIVSCFLNCSKVLNRAKRLTYKSKDIWLLERLLFHWSVLISPHQYKKALLLFYHEKSF